MATIKPDPDAAGASPAPLDEDVYEDAGDLEFNTDQAYKSLYLAKLPKFVWDAWSTIDDDAEIRIGTIRMESDEHNRQSLSMLLNPDLAVHQTLPREYKLDVQQEAVSNTFMFTEKDLPGFKSKSRMAFNTATANMPSRLTRPKKEKAEATPFDPNKRYQPYYKKAIPKRTTLAGKVAHEVNCVTVDTPESRLLLAERTLDAMRPKALTQFVDIDPSAIGGGFVVPGSIGASNMMNSFIKKSEATKKKEKGEKAARMPENELMDRLFACFRKYKYWSMKALRAELQQPEAYLRETLDKIAVLAKSGRFATQWSLKPQNQVGMYDTEDVGEMAPTMGGFDGADDDEDMKDEDDDDDDEDTKFIDVLSS